MNRLWQGGAIFVLIGIAGYATLPVWAKFLQASGLDPMDVVTWRFLFAMPLMWLVLLGLRIPAPQKPLPHVGLLGLGLLLAVAALTAFFGLERLPASTYILLFYTYPAMVALLNLALGERMPLQSWLALGLTLVGVALTVPDFSVGLSGDLWAGVLIAFGNALAVAVYFILSNRLLRGHEASVRASAWAITGAFLTMVAIMVVRGGVAVPSDGRTWLLLLALALISTVLPVIMFMVGIHRMGASKAAILSTLEPIGTMTLATLLLDEIIEPVQLVGGGLIIASVLLLQVRLRRRSGLAAVTGTEEMIIEN